MEISYRIQQPRVRFGKLANPIASVAAFNTIVESSLPDNPFACAGLYDAGTNTCP